MKTTCVWKWMTAVLAALLLTCFGTRTLAYERIDTGRETSLTLRFSRDETGFSGVEFRLYRVADVSDAAHFTLSGDFAAYPVSLDHLDSSGWRALAQTLDAYASRDGLVPMRTAETGADGKVLFDHLSAGMYLVTGENYVSGRYTYMPESFMVTLPSLNQDTDEWVYDAVASCKYDRDYDPPGGGGGDPSDLSRKVLKIWKDDGNEAERPESISVQLLRNGQVYDTVTLNASNNWRYNWYELDDSDEWQVVENGTPEGYTVSISRQGITFVMTNTKTSPGGTTPGGDNPSGGSGGSSATGWLSPILPQTGALWWPVPFMAAAGLLLFIIGWRKWKNGEGQA